MRIVRLLVIFVAGLAATTTGAATTEVVVRSGVRASDGLALDFLSQPAGRRGGVAFRGSTAALFGGQAGNLAVLAATGDPLPAPLRGTWNSFTRVGVSLGGTIAAVAVLDSPDATTGLFVFDGTSATSIALADVGPLRLNASGQLVYVTAGLTVTRWDPQGGATVIATAGRPAPAGGTFTSFSDARLNTSGTVAVEMIAATDLGGYRFSILVAPPGGPPHEIRTGSSPRGMDLNDHGEVAFIAGSTTTFDVLVSSAAGALVTRVAGSGDIVDGRVIERITTSSLFLDEDGGVTFRARLNRGTAYVRAFGGALTIASNPGVRASTAFLEQTDDTPLGKGFISVDGQNIGGQTAIPATRAGFYELTGGTPATLLTAGDEILQNDGGTGPFIMVGTDLVVRTLDTEGNFIFVVRDAAGTVRTLVPQPGPGLSLDLSAPTLVATRKSILVPGNLSESRTIPGIFAIDVASGRVKTIVRAEIVVGSHRIIDLGSFAAGDGRVVFRGLREDGELGLFTSGRPRPRVLATTGVEGLQPRRFTTFGTLAVNRRHVLFAAATPEGTDGVFRTRGRAARALASAAAAAPGGGLFAPLGTGDDGRPVLPLVAGGDLAAFIAPVDLGDGDERSALFVAGPGKTESVLRTGDPAPGGGIVAALGGVALSGRKIFADVSLSRTDTRAALLRIVP